MAAKLKCCKMMGTVDKTFHLLESIMVSRLVRQPNDFVVYNLVFRFLINAVNATVYIVINLC